jgi:hypothetical protein
MSVTSYRGTRVAGPEHPGVTVVEVAASPGILFRFEREDGDDEVLALVSSLHGLIASAVLGPGDVRDLCQELTARGMHLPQGAAPFRCQATLWSGPGHQSSHGCTRRDPHAPGDDHWITEVTQEWTGPEAFSD